MHFRHLLALLLAPLLLSSSVANAAIANGFQDTAVVTVSAPSILAFAPDGRLFIGEKASGKIRVYKSGALLTQPFLDLNNFVPGGTYFDTFNERGLLGIAFDPAFGTNGLVYVYYTICKTPGNPPQPGTNTCQLAKNRVARFIASGDVVDPTSHVVLLDDIDSDAGNHNAGWLGFGPLDGKLYVSVGDGGASSAKAQNLGSTNGKVLRINANGSIPSDNPFVGQTGARGEVWAYGLRNPFRCGFASDGRLFCADVGANSWEEIDVITKGANYGWPTTEGPFNAASFPQLTNPIYSYDHSGGSAAIIAGDFGAKTSFPGTYQQSFFFADFTRGVIQRALLAPSGVAVQSVDDLVTNIGGNSVTDLVAGPDGSLYYTAYVANQVRRITATATNRSPIAVASADVVSGVPPLTVNFSNVGSSDPDGDALTYSWNFGDGTATSSIGSPTHQYSTSGTYVATLTVSDGKATPGPGTDTLTITVGRPPAITISSPIDGASFRAGDIITVKGAANDPEDGALPSSSLHWKIIFHHADHIHPFIDDLPGQPETFETNTSGETDPNVWYEVMLSATDSTGLTGTASVMIWPITSDFTLQTNPPGLGITLDGQPKTSPLSITGVVGLHRTIGAPVTQTSGGQTYFFSTWSDGGLPTHDITTPELDSTFTVTFTPPSSCSAPFVIPAPGGTFASATGGASAQSGTCAASTTSPEQVFQWTPAVSGSATLATCGGSTSFDTVMYVRSGNCASGAQVACADDATGCGTTEPSDHHASLTSLTVTAGQTYFIVVDGYNGASGTFTLTVTPPSGPVPTTTRTATPVPTPSPTLTANPPTPSRTPTPIQTSTPTRTSTPQPLPTTTATATAVVTASPSPAACNPIQVPAAGGTFTGTTSGTSKFAGTCAASGNSPDQVFQWTPSGSGTAVIATCGGTTSFDTALYVRTGTCEGPQSACNDDTAGCATTEPNDHHGSLISLAVTAGQTYFIVVDGYNGAAGDFTLTITPPAGASPTTTQTATPSPTLTVNPPTPSRTPTPIQTSTPIPTSTPQPLPTTTASATTAPSPAPCNPIQVPAAGGTFTGTTSGTSKFAGTCVTSGNSPDQVFQWTPSGSGTAVIATCGGTTSFDTALYVRTGTCEGPQSACNDDTAGCATTEPNDHHGSLISLTVTAGQTYFIVVDGYNGAAGDFTLTITPPAGASPTATGTPGPTVTATPPPATTTPTRTATPTGTPVLTATKTASPTPVATATPDACNNATVVPPQGGTFTGVTSGSSTQSGSCGITDKSGERVFQWTPAVSGQATIGTCGTETLYDSVIYLRGGSCGGSELICVDDVAGCVTGEPNDHHGSRISPIVTAGQTYFIVVDGYNGTNGAFSLTIAPPAAATSTQSPTPVSTATVTRTATPVPTVTNVPSPTATRTTTPLPTVTPLPTASPTPTATATPTDACANPTVIPAAGGTFNGVTSGDNSQSGSCAVTNKGPERVYQWTPATSGTATISTCGTATLFDTVVYLRTTTCGGSELACNDDTVGCGTGEPNDYHGSRLTPVVTAGQTYFIVVDGYDTSEGAFALTVVPPVVATTTPTRTATPLPTATATVVATATATPLLTATRTVTPLPTATPLPSATTSPTAIASPVPNQCGATMVPSYGGTFTGVTSGSNTQSGSCGLTDKGPEAIFQWTPTASGQATIGTCGTGTLYDSVVYLRSGTCGGSELICVDDVAGCTTGEPNDHHGSLISPIVTAGQTYFIVVDGYNGAQGAFTLSITPPPDGTCNAPFVIPPGGGVLNGTTSGASALGSCASSGLSPEVVYRWTPSTSGTATLETCGGQTNYDTVLYITQSVCGGPSLTCVDDAPGCGTTQGPNGSRISPTVTAGETYYVVVDGFNGGAGSFSLNVIPPP